VLFVVSASLSIFIVKYQELSCNASTAGWSVANGCWLLYGG